MLNFFYKVFSPKQYERTFGMARSNKWPYFRDKFIKENPYCAVCSTSKNLEAHHILPFHLDITKELEISNLIPLCDRDHFLFGHLGNWASYNKTVIEDAKTWKQKINQRP